MGLGGFFPVDGAGIDGREGRGDAVGAAEIVDGLAASGDFAVVVNDDVAAWGELRIEIH